ncbi:ATP-dependent DNA helicase RecQ-like [Tubulanus polymorphus]|uniref:ATP-dependent DNA helicase RecQ-like n=1 Tax=Tubulanus polymorphus TaxID=672921 RepID=UPI003DA58D26
MDSVSSLSKFELQIFEEICRSFGLESLSSHQMLCLITVSRDRNDVFVSTKTGSGKTLSYQALPLFDSLLKKKQLSTRTSPSTIVIIVSPLISIMEEQCKYLKSLGFSASYIGHAEEENRKILLGEYQFVFCCPETLLAKSFWRNMVSSALYSERLIAIVVDEAHTLLGWGDSSKTEAFRAWFNHIGELRSLSPGVPVIALTATTSNRTRRLIRRNLCINSNAIEIVDSPDRENAKLSVLKSIMETAKVYNDLEVKVGHRHINMYHSCTPDPVKEIIRKDMSDPDGSIRVLICTSAAGMGVHNVVNFGPPYDVDMFLQMLGRAGRDGKQSDHILIYNGRQLNKKVDHLMTKYINT